jgi:elongation factor Ts
MPQVTITEITKLRQMTSAGMMDCKKALEESDGDIEKAVDLIRKRGLLVASKRADRSATEGAVLASTSKDGKFGVVTSLNCETDFVAKNQDFITLSQTINNAALEKAPGDLEALKNLQVSGKTVLELVTDKVGVVGEKMEVSFFGSIKAEKVVSYIHPGNGLAVVVGFNKPGLNDQVYKDIAMQVASMKPVAVDKGDVSATIVEKEKELGREKARTEGKPENMIEKIAEGMLNKFYKEGTLLNQEFIKDGKKTVRQYLQEADKELTVTGFKRYALKD